MDLFDMSLTAKQLAESEGVDYTQHCPPLPPPADYQSSSAATTSENASSPQERYASQPTPLPPSDASLLLDASPPLITGLSRIRCPTLVLGVQSDILFPVAQQKEIALCLRASANRPPVIYYELDSIYGHDTFLMDLQNVGAAIKGHLES
jgi:homoserine O-acetyltransferase